MLQNVMTNAKQRGTKCGTPLLVCERLVAK